MSDAIVRVTIKNADEIKSAFKTAPERVSAEIGTAINRIITRVENEAKREAPVNKQGGGGNLRQSITSKMTGRTSGMVEVGASYGVYVHEGTSPHIIRVRTKRVLADKRSNSIFGAVVHHPGTRANPFLQRAVDNQSSFIDKEFENAVERAVK